MSATALEQLGHIEGKVDVFDLTPELAGLAYEYLSNYEGSFGYLLDMRRVASRGALTVGQTKGVLNCIKAELRKTAAVESGERRADDGQALEPGIYVTAEGIVKVQQNRRKSNVYALVWTSINGERLNLDDEHVNGEWSYAPGLILSLKPEQKMTLDEAKHFTLVFGQCPRCGRTLKAADSVEAGIGPVCVKYFSFA